MKTMMVAAALAVIGCASDPHEEMRAEAAQVDALAHQLALEAESYCAAPRWAAPGGCADGVMLHREAVQGSVEALTEMADHMDGHLREVGSAVLADMACGVPAVQSEMDRHAAVACVAGDTNAAEAEALQHCAVLSGTAAQLHTRANIVFAATGHALRVGGSGSMPAHLRRSPSGEHVWPHDGNAEPIASRVCEGNP